MSDRYKNKVIINLSELLPPFVDSVIGLMNYVKDELNINADLMEKLVDVSLYSRKLMDSFTEETTFLKKELNRIEKSNDKSPKEVETLNKNFKEFNYIRGLSIEAINQINLGITNLLYLIYKEKNMLDKLKEKSIYKIFSDLEQPNIDKAVDNLYQGSKKLVEIIDKVID